MVLIDVMDLIGTAAFAISGVLVGIRNRLDLFGVFVLAVITASGGGMIRDIISQKGIPVFFQQPKYLITIILSTVAVSIIAYAAYHLLSKVHFLIQVFDAAGLGVFTVLTAYDSILLGMPLIGVVFVSVITGIGGGVLRDIMANDMPLVFKSEIYALASMLGSLCFYFWYPHLNVTLNAYLCIFIIFAIRMISIYFKLNLPVIKIREKAL